MSEIKCAAENTHGVFYVTAFVKRYCGGVVFFEASSCAHCKVTKAVAVIAVSFRKLLALWINAGVIMLAMTFVHIVLLVRLCAALEYLAVIVFIECHLLLFLFLFKKCK